MIDQIYSIISWSWENCCWALQHAAEHTYALRRTCMLMCSGNLCIYHHCSPAARGPSHRGGMNECESKAETTHSGWAHCEDVFPLTWKLPPLNKSWQSIPALRRFSFLSFILPILRICPWEATEKDGRGKKKENIDTSPQEVVRNHCFHGNGRQQ